LAEKLGRPNFPDAQRPAILTGKGSIVNMIDSSVALRFFGFGQRTVKVFQKVSVLRILIAVWFSASAVVSTQLQVPGFAEITEPGKVTR